MIRKKPEPKPKILVKYGRSILHKLQFSFFFVLFSFIFLKRFLTWWYHRKIRRNEIAMEKLKKQKAKLLDDVMETETYKVAKELLDDFATDAEKRQLNVRLFLDASMLSQLQD